MERVEVLDGAGLEGTRGNAAGVEAAGEVERLTDAEVLAAEDDLLLPLNGLRLRLFEEDPA